MRIDDLPPAISVERACKMLGVSRRSAYGAVAARGELPTFRLGGRMRVPTAKVLELLGLGVVVGDDRSDTGGEGAATVAGRCPRR